METDQQLSLNIHFKDKAQVYGSFSHVTPSTHSVSKEASKDNGNGSNSGFDFFPGCASCVFIHRRILIVFFQNIIIIEFMKTP